MLSPIPTRQEVGAPLASPGELLPSPVGWPLSSPHFGRTPGAYVVQEGRLSLEMFTGGETEDGRPGLRGSVDLFTGVAGTAHPAGAGQHKALSTAHINMYAAQLQKSVPAALAAATADQLDAKDVYAAKLLQELPERLNQQVEKVVADAKQSLGLQAYDSRRVEGHLKAALQEQQNNATPSNAPGAVASAPAKAGRALSSGAAAPEEPAAHHVRSAKRAHAEICPPEDHVRSPRQRLERIRDLELQLRSSYEKTRSLQHAVEQAELRRDAATSECTQLLNLAAHINSALTAALVERKAMEAAAATAATETAAIAAAAAAAHQTLLRAEQQQQTAQPEWHAQQAQLPTARPGVTPAGEALPALFSPGTDVWAACNMFIDPADRATPGDAGEKRKLFEDAAPLPAAP